MVGSGHEGVAPAPPSPASCDQSLALVARTRRAWQNRAAANLALGQLDASMRDLEKGLAINPESQESQQTLASARHRERPQQQQLDNLVES